MKMRAVNTRSMAPTLMANRKPSVVPRLMASRRFVLSSAAISRRSSRCGCLAACGSASPEPVTAASAAGVSGRSILAHTMAAGAEMILAVRR